MASLQAKGLAPARSLAVCGQSQSQNLTGKPTGYRQAGTGRIRHLLTAIFIHFILFITFLFILYFINKPILSKATYIKAYTSPFSFR